MDRGQSLKGVGHQVMSRFGSATDIQQCPHHVRFPPDSDQIADITPRLRRAMNGLMHHSKKRPYSMTSSEIASTLAGMSKPSALAVLRLITSGYLIDCITGKSAGFMPLRIFAA